MMVYNGMGYEEKTSRAVTRAVARVRAGWGNGGTGRDGEPVCHSPGGTPPVAKVRPALPHWQRRHEEEGPSRGGQGGSAVPGLGHHSASRMEGRVQAESPDSRHRSRCPVGGAEGRRRPRHQSRRPWRGCFGIKPTKQSKTGAGYATTRAGATQHTARLGLGAMADNYDGELAALAAAASYAVCRFNADPTITRWIFYSDNVSPVQSIGDRGDRPGQQYARIFESKVDKFLAGCNERKVEVRWTPGHVSVPRNELADNLAKQAVQLPAISRSMVTWAKAESTHQAAAAWKADWKKWCCADAWWAPVTCKAPKLKPLCFLKAPNLDHAGACRAFQAVLGHTMTGEYYKRLMPSESPRCQCGIPFESNLHALLYCPAAKTSRRAVSDILSGRLVACDKPIKTLSAANQATQ
jgi:ribonuclease HI